MKSKIILRWIVSKNKLIPNDRRCLFTYHENRKRFWLNQLIYCTLNLCTKLILRETYLSHQVVDHKKLREQVPHAVTAKMIITTDDSVTVINLFRFS